MYCYLDLYNAYQTLLLEPLSGFQCPQCQTLLNLILIPKSIKKTKSANQMLYRNNIFFKKGCIISIFKEKVVTIKDCHSLDHRFLKEIRSLNLKQTKKLRLGHLDGFLSHVRNTL